MLFKNLYVYPVKLKKITRLFRRNITKVFVEIALVQIQLDLLIPHTKKNIGVQITVHRSSGDVQEWEEEKVAVHQQRKSNNDLEILYILEFLDFLPSYLTINISTSAHQHYTTLL